MSCFRNNFPVAQIVCGVLLMIMNIPPLYWTMMNENKSIYLSILSESESRYRVSLACGLLVSALLYMY